MTDAPRGVEVDLLVEGVPLPKHRDTTGENRTYVIASPDREYTIQVRSSEIDCLATACVEGHRVLCRSESFLPVWKGKSRSFCGFETERALRPVEHGTDLEQSTTHRPFVFTVPEGREDVQATAMRCVEVRLFEVEKDLVPWRGARAGCVHSRVEEPQRPILASHERKNYYVCGEEPIATRPGDPVTSTRRMGSGYRWVGDRKMRERVKQGPPLGRIVIHYVGRDQANRLRALPSQPRALAAPPWAGAFGAAPAADPSRPRVVVDAPNVARYFAAATSAGRQRPADMDALVLEGVLDALVAEAPDALLVLVFSLSSSAGLGAHRLRERYPGRVTLRCLPHGEDVDAVALREAAAPDSRGCLLSNDHFQDYVDEGVVSDTWVSRFRIGFEIRGDATTFRPPAPHNRLGEFLAAIPLQGQVLGTSGTDAGFPSVPLPALPSEPEGEDVAEEGEALGVEEYALQRALEQSMGELQLEDSDIDWAIAASLAEHEEGTLPEEVEEVVELGGPMASEEAQLRWALEASLREAQPAIQA